MRIYLRPAGDYLHGGGWWRPGFDPLLELKPKVVKDAVPDTKEMDTATSEELSRLLLTVRDLDNWFKSPEEMNDETEQTARVRMVTLTADQRDYTTVIHTALVAPPSIELLEELLRVIIEKVPSQATNTLHCPVSWLAVIKAAPPGKQGKE